MFNLVLNDGRKLSYDIYGDPKGEPVIFNHGFSDSRLIRNPDENIVRSLGLKIIVADQPGVGTSSPLPNRKMLDWGSDMQQLADHLKLKSFAVAGHSGGAPHALAIAQQMPKRVTKIVLASPAADFAEPGMTKLVKNKDLKLIVKLHRFHHILRWAYKYGSRTTLKNPSKFLQQTAKADASDTATYFRTLQQQKMFEQSFVTGMAQKGEGVYEMTLALWGWGFQLGDITHKVELFYGTEDDILDTRMPLYVGDHLPNCSVHAWKGAGHYGFVDTHRWKEFFGSLC